jgi:GAF domain-containing protein
VLEASSAYYADTRELSLLQRLSSAGKGPRVDLEELERFRILGERLLFRPGEGLQGRVWSTGIPEKWPPASSMRSPIIDMRLQLARLAGLRSGIAVPLIVEGQVLAVLVFFSWQAHPPYEALLRLLAHTTQLPSEPLAGITGEH